MKNGPRVRLISGASKSIRRFWPMMGPYIASREVRKELNDNIFDDDQTSWFIMYTETGREPPTHENVLGFCCAKISPSKCELKHDFIRSEYRGARRYSILFDARDRYLRAEHPQKSQEIVTKDKAIIEKLKSKSFKETGSRGSYRIFSRPGEKM